MNKVIINQNSLPSGAFKEMLNIHATINEISSKLNNLNQVITSNKN